MKSPNFGLAKYGMYSFIRTRPEHLFLGSYYKYCPLQSGQRLKKVDTLGVFFGNNLKKKKITVFTYSFLIFLIIFLTAYGNLFCFDKKVAELIRRRKKKIWVDIFR